MGSCVRSDTRSLTAEIRHVTTLQSSGTQRHTWFSILPVQQGNKGCQQRGWRGLDNKRVASGVEKSHDGIRKKEEHQLVVAQPTNTEDDANLFHECPIATRHSVRGPGSKVHTPAPGPISAESSSLLRFTPSCMRLLDIKRRLRCSLKYGKHRPHSDL